MREVLETYKPNLLTRRRRLVTPLLSSPVSRKTNKLTLLSYFRLIEDFIRDLMLNNDHIHVLEQKMRDAIKMGLTKEGHEDSSVKCFPTFVRELPNGKENGKFLSLDLGGTNFRVIFMELTAQKEFMMDSKIYAIPHSIMIGPGVGLFDHIAE